MISMLIIFGGMVACGLIILGIIRDIQEKNRSIGRTILKFSIHRTEKLCSIRILITVRLDGFITTRQKNPYIMAIG